MPAQDAAGQLITLIGGPYERPEPARDWAAIETSLGGIALPTDFKAFLDRVPPGRFANKLLPVYPGLRGFPQGDFLAPTSHIVQTMHMRRTANSATFPHPIFPEPGGLLVWGTGAERIYFWLTQSGDADEWPVVCCDRSYSNWQTYPAGMAQFLIGEIRAGKLPPYQPFPLPAPRTFARPKDNEKPSWPSLAKPFSQVDALIAAIDPPPTSRTHTDWVAIETRHGTALPQDYKTFIDACGAGQLCDLTIASADSCRSHDMFILQAKQTATAARAGLTQHLSFHPADKGLLCWGIAPDGTFLNWKTVDPNPDLWSVAFFRPGTVSFYEEFSFSTFLLRYAGLVPGMIPPVVTATGQPWTAGITFTHHECPSDIVGN